MKKSLFVLGVAVAALASCTNEEVMEVAENRTIQFDAFVNNATKANVEIETATFTKFWVYGAYNQESTTWTPVFTNNVVNKNTNWESEKVAYWTANKEHRFAAYANGTSQLTSGVTFDAATGTNGTLKFTDYAVGDNDLVAAVTEAITWNGTDATEKVDFTFKHLLSKVKFTFTTDATNDYVMKIENLKIVTKGSTNPIVKAGCDFTGDITNLTWIASSDQGTGYYSYETLADCAGGTNATEKYVIPQNNALTVSFDVTFTDGVNEIAKKTGVTGDLTIAAETAWKAGNVYNYQVEINPDDVNDQLKKIEFDNISVDKWTDSSNQPSEIQEQLQ